MAEPARLISIREGVLAGTPRLHEPDWPHGAYVKGDLTQTGDLGPWVHLYVPGYAVVDLLWVTGREVDADCEMFVPYNGPRHRDDEGGENIH